MWKQRNDILHERDATGLLRTSSKQLHSAIVTAYKAGTSSLHLFDCHLNKSYSLAQLTSMSVFDKRNWLFAIKSARKYKLALDEDTEQMRTLVEDYVGFYPSL